MKDIWFISDTHFYHKNILQYEPEARGMFSSSEEMTEVMIERWNSLVKPQDIVYHLGDVFFGGKKNFPVIDRLNGSKRLIRGNHDHYKPTSRYEEYFKSVYGVREFNLSGFRVIMSHVPVHVQQLEERFDFNLHGHLHSKKIDDPRYINLSCEHWNLAPVHYDTIHQIMREVKG